jgi:hypothetical protein
LSPLPEPAVQDDIDAGKILEGLAEPPVERPGILPHDDEPVIGRERVGWRTILSGHHAGLTPRADAVGRGAVFERRCLA